MQPGVLSLGGTAAVGSYRDVAVPSPAAGAEWALTLPAGYFYRVGLGYARFVTSATVATRTVGFQVTDGDGNLRYIVASNDAITATETWDVGYATGGALTPNGAGTVNAITLPSVILPAGWSIGSNTHNLQAADQYSRVRLWLEQIWDEQPGDVGRHAPHPHLAIDLEVGRHAT